MLRMYEGVLEIAHILPTITFFRKIETDIFCTKRLNCTSLSITYMRFKHVVAIQL